MSLFRDILAALPSDNARLAARALDLIDEEREAYRAAVAVLPERGPFAALDAFAASTTTPLDDALVAQLRELVTGALTSAETAMGVLGIVAVSLDGDRAKELIDGARRWLVDVGYQAGAWKHEVSRWLADERG